MCWQCGASKCRMTMTELCQLGHIQWMNWQPNECRTNDRIKRQERKFDEAEQEKAYQEESILNGLLNKIMRFACVRKLNFSLPQKVFFFVSSRTVHDTRLSVLCLLSLMECRWHYNQCSQLLSIQFYVVLFYSYFNHKCIRNPQSNR